MSKYLEDKEDHIQECRDDLDFWKYIKSIHSDRANSINSLAKENRQQILDIAMGKEQATINRNKVSDRDIDDIINTIDYTIKKETYFTPAQRFKRGIVIASALAAFFVGGVYYNKNTNVVDTQYTYAEQNIATEVEQTTETAPPPIKEFWYFPVRGDTLSGISKNVSGVFDNYRDIKNHNGLNSDLIEVNQPLRIPAGIIRNSSNLYQGSLESKVYMVDKHDTWQSISRIVYGNEDNAHILISHNRKYNPRFSTKLWNKQYVLVPK